MLLATLTACTPDPSPIAPDPEPSPAPPSTSASDPFSSARTAADAPDEIRASQAKVPCGDVVLGVGVAVPTEAADCLEQRIGRSPAELAVARYTTEGDPIVTFYLIYPELAGYDVVVDQRQDHFSSGGWARVRCTGSRALDDPAATCADR